MRFLKDGRDAPGTGYRDQPTELKKHGRMIGNQSLSRPANNLEAMRERVRGRRPRPAVASMWGKRQCCNVKKRISSNLSDYEVRLFLAVEFDPCMLEGGGLPDERWSRRAASPRLQAKPILPSPGLFLFKGKKMSLLAVQSFFLTTVGCFASRCVVLCRPDISDKLSLSWKANATIKMYFSEEKLP